MVCASDRTLTKKEKASFREDGGPLPPWAIEKNDLFFSFQPSSNFPRGCVRVFILRDRKKKEKGEDRYRRTLIAASERTLRIHDGERRSLTDKTEQISDG
ncbi:hypothetical protein KPH14_010063 [Odynerus spinipes]|uniref:Uncharacterized protein n=1 Tax=Odynerus spinipes TaxID=1348599 RepID=A0AAD9RTF1_9HYME|nr:hypothetical protein KPH14_010063 [Odynerus spinipes]